MKELRFLPNPESDAEGTQVPLLSGHIARVYAKGPDGKPGTPLESRFQKAAIQAGCSVVGVSDHVNEASNDQEKVALIVRAIETVVETGDSDDLDGQGRPKLAVVKRVAGFGITKSELDTAFAAFTADLDGEEEGTEEAQGFE